MVTAISTLAVGSVHLVWPAPAAAMNPTGEGECSWVASRLQAGLPVRYWLATPEQWHPDSKSQMESRIDQWSKLPNSLIPWKDAKGEPFVTFEPVDSGPADVLVELDSRLAHGNGWTACDSNGILHVYLAHQDATDSAFAPSAAGAAAHEFGHVISGGGVGAADHTSGLNSNSGSLSTPPLLTTCGPKEASTVANDDRSFQQFFDFRAPNNRSVTHNVGFENTFDGWKAPGAAVFAVQMSGSNTGQRHAAWQPANADQVLVPIHRVNVSWRPQNADDYPGFQPSGMFRNSSANPVTLRLTTRVRGIRWGSPDTFSPDSKCSEIDPGTGQPRGVAQYPDGQNHNIRANVTDWHWAFADVEVGVGDTWTPGSGAWMFPDTICEQGAAYLSCDWQAVDTTFDLKMMSPATESVHIDDLEMRVHECPGCIG